jgi:farnesyl diphosphate synthase
MLLLSVVEACQPNLVKNSLKAALALECLHTYSLIHDDLPSMDNSPLRRGQETLHITYDEVTAILAGDALNTYAFELLATCSLSDKTKVELILLLAKNGGLGGMVLGQAIDCNFENQKISLEDLIILHQNKTGKLIASSLVMGAAICALDEDKKTKLYDFGMKIGLFFQVRDDILDVVSTEAESGKMTGNDGAKNSFVNLLGLEGARVYNSNLASQIRENLSEFGTKLQGNLNQLLQSYLKEI